jgi:hypothetical protein
VPRVLLRRDGCCPFQLIQAARLDDCRFYRGDYFVVSLLDGQWR